MHFIKFPLLMRRKEKIKALDFLIEHNRKDMRKRKCEVCGRKLTKDNTRWSIKKEEAKNNVETTLEDWVTCCIVCKEASKDGASEFFNKEEMEELRIMKSSQ